jgi:tRNA threonylcarbamoyladenosine biosynthesis protein TsaE
MQGLVRGLGGSEKMVQSPTFVYLNLYPTSIPVFHFDLYRLRTPEEFCSMGFHEYFEQGGITAIEWPERIASILPSAAIAIRLTHISENVRRLVIS